MKQIKYASQKGFTLIELLIVVILIGILSAVLLTNAGTDKTKVTSLIGNMGTLQTNLARFNADTGCYPVKIQALFDKTQATGTATDVGFCTSSVASSITDPYMDATAYNATTNAITFNKVGAGVEVSTAYDATNKIWYMKAAGLSPTILNLAALECNGMVATATAPTAWTNSTKCIISGTDMLMAFNRK